ncbi:MAG: hypothetical protein AB7N73_08480 [Gemmatimonadales bacterium]
MLRPRWTALLLLGLMTGSLAEPVLGSACAVRTHPDASVVTTTGQGSGPVLDLHHGQPVKHPGHGSGADHCMHQHGIALGTVPGALAILSLDRADAVGWFAGLPPRVALPPPFRPPRA